MAKGKQTKIISAMLLSLLLIAVTGAQAGQPKRAEEMKGAAGRENRRAVPASEVAAEEYKLPTNGIGNPGKSQAQKAGVQFKTQNEARHKTAVGLKTAGFATGQIAVQLKNSGATAGETAISLTKAGFKGKEVQGALLEAGYDAQTVDTVVTANDVEVN